MSENVNQILEDTIGHTVQKNMFNMVESVKA